jgi:prevent-host-death family protein
MKTYGSFEAKTHLSALLNEVCEGEEIVITRHGKPVAKLSPLNKKPHRSVQETVRSIKERSRVLVLEDATVQDLIDEGRKR